MLKEEKFLKARETFVKKAKKDFSSVASVGWYVEGGRYVNDNNPQCHVGLDYFNRHGEKDPLVIFSGFQRGNRPCGDKKELGEAFFNYLKNQPVWGRAILNDTFEDVYENGWMFDTNYERNLLCSSVFATRWPTEFPDACRAFVTFTKNGMHPDMAFVLSTISYQGEGEENISHFHRSGHMPCASGAPEEFVKRFLSYSYTKGDQTYKESPGYSGIDKVFFSGDYGYDKSSLFYRVKSSLSQERGFTPTKDIFYTKEIWAEQQKRAGGENSWTIRPKDMANVVKEMNQYREEVLT